MMTEMSTLPISGRVLIAGAVYVGASLLVLGPLVAERSIEKSDWNSRCQATLRAELAARQSPPREIPKLDCESLVGRLLPEFGELCQHYGNPDFSGLASDMLRAQDQMERAIEARQLERAAAQTGTRCECAAAAVSQDHVWAIHAGSLRLITPAAVKKLDTQLQQALHLPSCAERE